MEKCCKDTMDSVGRFPHLARGKYKKFHCLFCGKVLIDGDAKVEKESIVKLFNSIVNGSIKSALWRSNLQDGYTRSETAVKWINDDAKDFLSFLNMCEVADRHSSHIRKLINLDSDSQIELRKKVNREKEYNISTSLFNEFIKTL